MAAFLVAPAAAPLTLAVTVFSMGGSGWIFAFVLAACVCYWHAFFLGFPLYLWLRRSGRTSIPSVIVGSFCIGAIPMALFMLFAAAEEAWARALDISSFINLLRDNALTWPGLIQPVIATMALGALGAITGVVWLLVAGGFGAEWHTMAGHTRGR